MFMRIFCITNYKKNINNIKQYYGIGILSDSKNQERFDNIALSYATMMVVKIALNG